MRVRYETDEKPEPKSSSAMRMPAFSAAAPRPPMPVDTLKIDRVFISELENDVGQLKVVRSIIALAGALDLQIIGEGVERTEEMTTLQKL